MLCDKSIANGRPPSPWAARPRNQTAGARKWRPLPIRSGGSSSPITSQQMHPSLDGKGPGPPQLRTMRLRRTEKSGRRVQRPVTAGRGPVTACRTPASRCSALNFTTSRTSGPRRSRSACRTRLTAASAPTFRCAPAPDHPGPASEPRGCGILLLCACHPHSCAPS